MSADLENPEPASEQRDLQALLELIAEARRDAPVDGRTVKEITDELWDD